MLEEAVNWIYSVCRGSSTDDPYSTISGGWKTDLNFKINKKKKREKENLKKANHNSHLIIASVLQLPCNWSGVGVIVKWVILLSRASQTFNCCVLCRITKHILNISCLLRYFFLTCKFFLIKQDHNLGEKLRLKYWHMIVYEWLMPLPGFFWSSSSGENQR